MAEFVKKTALGYKPVTGGSSDSECTHAILTLGEYDGLKREISNAKQAVEDIKFKAAQQVGMIKNDAEQNLWRVQNDAQMKLASQEHNAKEKIKKLKDELAAEQQESALQRGLNVNLLKITRERANADRGLKPKKEHTGYVVLTSAEKEHRYKDAYGHFHQFTLWETAMETPYTVDFDAKQVRSLVRELFQEDEHERCQIRKIGITENYPGRYTDMIQDKEWRGKYKDHNVMLEQRLRANYRSGYWELVFLHTKPLSVVPPDMRARRGWSLADRMPD